MKKLIVISVAGGLLFLANSFSPAPAQEASKDSQPTFYHLLPGTYVNAWPRFTVTYPKD